MSRLLDAMVDIKTTSDQNAAAALIANANILIEKVEQIFKNII